MPTIIVIPGVHYYFSKHLAALLLIMLVDVLMLTKTITCVIEITCTVTGVIEITCTVTGVAIAIGKIQCNNPMHNI